MVALRRTKCNTCRCRQRRGRYKDRGLCRRCGAERKSGHNYCEKCLKKLREEGVARSRKLKRTVITHYGGVCAYLNCPEHLNPHIEFLTIDHINNDGAAHRRELKRWGGTFFYKWLIQQNYPAGFQVLCFNCNCAKGLFGECSHQKIKVVLPSTSESIEKCEFSRGQQLV